MEYFILGLLTVSCFQPIIEGITNLVLTMIECAKGYFGIKITQYNQKLMRAEEGEVKPVGQIGFTYETEEEENDDE